MSIHKLYLYEHFWDPNQLELIPVGPPSPCETVTFKIPEGDPDEVYVSSNRNRVLFDEAASDYHKVPFDFIEGDLETDIEHSRKLYAEYRSRGYRKTLLNV